MKEQEEAKEREAHKASLLLEKLRIKSRTPPHASEQPPVEQEKPNTDIEAPGTGPENAIAPEGTRDV